MPKRGDDVAAELERAALHLFRERGYDQTTAAAIAGRAGVTERTFFRYFADKREVLFQGQALVHAMLTSAIADAPRGLGPLATLLGAFRTMSPGLEAHRSWLTERHAVIAATPALHERDLMKTAMLEDALADALRARGVTRPQAVIAAGVGMTAFKFAISAWLTVPGADIGEHLEHAWGDLDGLLTGHAASVASAGD